MQNKYVSKSTHLVRPMLSWMLLLLLVVVTTLYRLWLQVSRSWHSLAEDNVLWSQICRSMGYTTSLQ